MNKKVLYLIILLIAVALGYFLLESRPITATEQPQQAYLPEDEQANGRPVSLKAARQLLQDHGWQIDMTSDSSDELGCLTASLYGHEGRVCFFSCNGKSAPEIAKFLGETYGYHIGKTNGCRLFTEIIGDNEFRTFLKSQ